MTSKQQKNTRGNHVIQIGVDTGGTFTDLVMVRNGRVLTWKTPSTPADFTDGIMKGVDALLSGFDSVAPPFSLVHSTTVATNALLERKGARIALVTTEGFRDVLELGRQTRPELYNLNVLRPEPLVPRRLRFEIPERVGADGNIVRELDRKRLREVVGRIKRSGVESAAVSLLFSFLQPAHEKVVVEALQKEGLNVSASSDILPEFREYERTSTTVLNAYVAPVMSRYLGQLQPSLKKAGCTKLRVMQSSGGSISPGVAGKCAVTTLLSGPAAGVIGAMSLARQALGGGRREPVNIITFDMGGTSTDVSLVEGIPKPCSETQIGGFPAHVPMMDIHTVGAGGGSLAWVDPGGALQVGPDSAGVDPGPACYGRGLHAAVTDANLVLGRIHPGHFLDGRMKLDPAGSLQAMEKIGREMKCDSYAAADAIIRIVNAGMERAIRVTSVERGYDPRDFTLVSFGGAGGLHCCELAESLNIPVILIPRNPGVLSAWGALTADVVREYSRTVMLDTDRDAEKILNRTLLALSRQAEREMKKEGFPGPDTVLHSSLDMRYSGQSYELNVGYSGNLLDACMDFHREHKRRYGHSAENERLQAVNIRLRAVGLVRNKPVLEPVSRGTRKVPGEACLVRNGRWPVFERHHLKAGNVLNGPALVVESYATTLVPRGWSARVDRWGNLVLELHVS
jgi:N-methylhydantoinase A